MGNFRWLNRFELSTRAIDKILVIIIRYSNSCSISIEIPISIRFHFNEVSIHSSHNLGDYLLLSLRRQKFPIDHHTSGQSFVHFVVHKIATNRKLLSKISPAFSSFIQTSGVHTWPLFAPNKLQKCFHST